MCFVLAGMAVSLAGAVSACNGFFFGCNEEQECCRSDGCVPCGCAAADAACIFACTHKAAAEAGIGTDPASLPQPEVLVTGAYAMKVVVDDRHLGWIDMTGHAFRADKDGGTAQAIGADWISDIAVANDAIYLLRIGDGGMTAIDVVEADGGTEVFAGPGPGIAQSILADDHTVYGVVGALTLFPRDGGAPIHGTAPPIDTMPGRLIGQTADAVFATEASRLPDETVINRYEKSTGAASTLFTFQDNSKAHEVLYAGAVSEGCIVGAELEDYGASIGGDDHLACWSPTTGAELARFAPCDPPFVAGDHRAFCFGDHLKSLWAVDFDADASTIVTMPSFGTAFSATSDDTWIYLSLVDGNQNGVISRVRKPRP